MNTYTFKIGFKVNDILTAVNCPLEAFIVSVDKTAEIKEANERKGLSIYIEDYMCSDKEYALSAQYMCSMSELLQILNPIDDDEKDEDRYARAAKEFCAFIPYIKSQSVPVVMEVEND